MDDLTDFNKLLSEAVNDMADQGYVSAERVAMWTRRLREAAESSLESPEALEAELRRRLEDAYREKVEKGKILDVHPGAQRYTLERVRPALRGELDRRIMASANLIRLNRAEAINKTLRRFQGWATSTPAGGTPEPEKRETKRHVRKALAQLPYEERRVLIDQGAKLVASISELVASDGGAIAAQWSSRWRQAGYDYREDHKELDGKVFLIRDSWAHRAGFVKPTDGYFDDITKPAVLPFCRCSAVYKYALRDLPDDMITAKGRAALEQVRERIAGDKGEAATVKVGGETKVAERSPVSEASGDKIVMVDPRAFDPEFAKQREFYVPPGGEGAGAIGGRYQRFKEFLATHKSFQASEVGVLANGQVGFTNGRHRYAVLRDMGVAAIPVAMDPESVRNARKHGLLHEPRHRADSIGGDDGIDPIERARLDPFGSIEDLARLADLSHIGLPLSQCHSFIYERLSASTARPEGNLSCRLRRGQARRS